MSKWCKQIFCFSLKISFKIRKQLKMNIGTKTSANVRLPVNLFCFILLCRIAEDLIFPNKPVIQLGFRTLLINPPKKKEKTHTKSPALVWSSFELFKQKSKETGWFESSGIIYDCTTDYSSHPFGRIGQMDVVCEHCGALKFAGETLTNIIQEPGFKTTF